uniref:Uncharacterized protein n=1 Tax=Anguilla anguilla TaxID=7936 RepID=A0A0E9SVL0_ANGAN
MKCNLSKGMELLLHDCCAVMVWLNLGTKVHCNTHVHCRQAKCKGNKTESLFE